MDTEKAIKILKSHNLWRRDNSGEMEMQDPKELGKAIDHILMIMGCLFETKKVTYHLCNDGGANTITMDVLIPECVTFKHEYGHYIVSEIINDNGELVVMCDKLSREGL